MLNSNEWERRYYEPGSSGWVPHRERFYEPSSTEWGIHHKRSYEPNSSQMRLLLIYQKYRRDFIHQIFTLEQGDMSVTEYTMKFKELRMMCSLIEDPRMMILQYKHGLNVEIQRKPQRNFIDQKDVIGCAIMYEKIVMKHRDPVRRLKLECPSSLRSSLCQKATTKNAKTTGGKWKSKRVAENMNQQASNQRERPEIKVDEKEDTTQTADEEILM